MGLFKKENVERLNKAGVYVEIDKEYTKKERENMNYKLNEYIYSHSTKNNDIPDLLFEYKEELNLLGK